MFKGVSRVPRVWKRLGMGRIPAWRLAAAAKAEPSKKPFLVQAGKAKEEPAAEARLPM